MLIQKANLISIDDRLHIAYNLKSIFIFRASINPYPFLLQMYKQQNSSLLCSTKSPQTSLPVLFQRVGRPPVLPALEQ